MSSTDGLDIAQQTDIHANLRSGRSYDKKLIRATSALHVVMSPPVSAWLSLASSPAICSRFLSSPSPLGVVTAYIALILPFHGAWSRRVVRSFQLKTIRCLPDVSLIHLSRDAVTTRGQKKHYLVKLPIYEGFVVRTKRKGLFIIRPENTTTQKRELGEGRENTTTQRRGPDACNSVSS